MKGFEMRRWARVQSVDAGSRLELFMIAAVATVLIVRLYLDLTGYPQLGSGDLHIAHLLWGGLLMLIGLISMMSYLGRHTMSVAAVTSGIGFGLFVDEIGKFVTRNNDYFYRPAIPLIYVIFVLLYFAARTIARRHQLSPTVALANALDLARDAVVHGWTTEERTQALRLLCQADQANPLVSKLRQVLGEIPATPLRASRFDRVGTWMSSHYRRIVESYWFQWAIVVFCLVKVFAAVVWFFNYMFALVTFSLGGESSFLDITTAAATFAGAAFVVTGFGQLRHNRRVAGFERLKYAALLSVFVGSFLSFYRNQLGGIVDLGFNLAVLSALQFMINQARDRGDDAGKVLDKPDPFQVALQLSRRALARRPRACDAVPE